MLRTFNLIKNYFYVTFSINKANRIKDYKTYFQNLKGKSGLEIGGPSPVFGEGGIIPIYSIIKNLDGCNFSDNTVWEGKIKEGKQFKYDGRCGYQFISDTVDLSAIKSGSYQFILASHVLEHIANPLKALSEWLRVLKDRGILLLILPDKEYTFDHKRSVTTLQHLIEDFQNDIKEDDLTHLDEIMKLHDFNLHNPTGDVESFRKRSINNYENRCLHQHVFDSKLIMELFDYFNIELISSETFPPYHIIFLGRKSE